MRVQYIGATANPFEMLVNILGEKRTATLYTKADASAIQESIVDFDDPDLDILVPDGASRITDAQ